MIKKLFRNASPAQAIVLIAVAFAGLVSIIGIMTDGGMYLIQYARLKRAVDAASIGAAQQFRKNFTQADLTNSALEFLYLNQSDVIPSSVKADTCDSIGNNPSDPLCAIPLRKLVRVTASKNVTFGFLRIIGIDSAVVSATSVGEAASIDLVMVIDTSISMAAATDWTNNGGSCPTYNPPDPNCENDVNPGDDPSVCNLNNSCEPMKDVKAVAKAFADKLFYPYDRLSIVPLTSQSPGGDRNPYVSWYLQSTGDAATDQANVDTAIDNLRVYQPPECIYTSTNPGAPIASSPPNASQSCLDYGPQGSAGGGTFLGENCPLFRNTGDPTTCPSTNGGGGLYEAGYEFSDSAHVEVRKDSFWATILILSGTPNSSFAWPGDTSHPHGYCPDYGDLWGSPNGGPLCIQPSMTWQVYPPTPDATRHYGPTPPATTADPNYTSLDYARDMADWLANPETGQGASIFTIGLGNRVENSSTYHGTADPAEAETFLEYAAKTAGDPQATNHGNYYYAPDTSTLPEIFDDIYQNITTRLSQ